MTLDPRHDPDMAALPDSKTEMAALADFTDRRATHDYETTLGDLIVDSLIGRRLVDDVEHAPECWEAFEHALLQQTAIDIRLAHIALAAHGGPTDDLDADTLSVVELSKHLRHLSRRTEAAAELSERLRAARWGHPNFGGGAQKRDVEEVKRTKELGRKAAEDFIACTRSGTTDQTPEAWARDSFTEPQEPWAFASVAPSLNEAAAWDVFRHSFSLELMQHGLSFDEARLPTGTEVSDG